VKKKKAKTTYRVTCRSTFGKWDVDIYRGRYRDAAMDHIRNMRHTDLCYWVNGRLTKKYPALPQKPTPKPITPTERTVLRAARQLVADNDEWKKGAAIDIDDLVERLSRAVRADNVAKKGK
jgi:hypothetical protein